jgi:predicted transcriptional regulator
MSDDQPNDMATRTRDPGGKFTRDLATAERDAEATKLRARGLSFRAIAAELGMSPSSAHEAVQRCLAEAPAEAAGELRPLELERLDEMWRAVSAVMKRDHVTVSQGRIVRARVLDENGDPIIVTTDKDGKPIFREEEILDDGPVLAAVGRLLDIQKRRAALLGLDAPQKVEQGGKLTYEIVGVDLGAL